VRDSLQEFEVIEAPLSNEIAILSRKLDLVAIVFLVRNVGFMS
jgi:hypothetical protein